MRRATGMADGGSARNRDGNRATGKEKGAAAAAAAPAAKLEGRPKVGETRKEKLMAFGWCCVHLTFWQSMPPINRSSDWRGLGGGLEAEIIGGEQPVGDCQGNGFPPFPSKKMIC